MKQHREALIQMLITALDEVIKTAEENGGAPLHFEALLSAKLDITKNPVSYLTGLPPVTYVQAHPEVEYVKDSRLTETRCFACGKEH